MSAADAGAGACVGRYRARVPVCAWKHGLTLCVRVYVRACLCLCVRGSDVWFGSVCGVTDAVVIRVLNLIIFSCAEWHV